MGWRLKSGLGKKVVYQAMLDNNITEIDFPSIRQCDFRHITSSYWLNFVSNDTFYEVYFSIWGGSVQFFIDRKLYDDFDECISKRVASFAVPFDYLIDHGMLREVA